MGVKLALICLCAIAMDRFFSAWYREQALAQFDWLAEKTEARLGNSAEFSPAMRRTLGGGALLMLIAPPALAAWMLSAIPYLGVLVDGALLYLALGASALAVQADGVRSALQSGNLELAWERVEQMSKLELGVIDEEVISLVTVESVLWGACDRMLGALFWFLLAGAPGLVAYRLTNLLKMRWIRREPAHPDFAWVAVWLNEILNWVPVRLTALTYMALGRRQIAWHCWRDQGASWKTSNETSLLAAGGGALGLQLGGTLKLDDYRVQRPSVGEGLLPRGEDIARSLGLVGRALGLWAGLLVMMACLSLLVG